MRCYFIVHQPVTLLCVLAACGIVACSASGNPPGPLSPDPAPTAGAYTVSFPADLPVDRVQPWETVDSSGMVIPPRDASGINLDSELVPGVELFRHGGDVSDYGAAARIFSGGVGESALSHAIYRIPLAGQQPGVISADVNLRLASDGATSNYWIGISNYDRGGWDWHGGFDVSHVRLTLPPAGYLSALGNLFVCIVAWNGATFDVVAVGANPRDPDDTTAPPPPGTPTLTPLAGALRVEWLPVAAGDLAGYLIHYSNEAFDSLDNPEVQSVPYLEGGTFHYLHGLSAETHIRIEAVDISGNRSALSPSAAALPGPGDAPGLELASSSASGLIGDPIELLAFGAESYDWDLDGDGLFDITGDPTGVQLADTTHLGIIRPVVRGTTGDPTVARTAAVSLIVSGNARPAASGFANPSSGPAPLDVNFTGEGMDPDGTIASFMWDFNGDGFYDYFDPLTANIPLPETYATPGLYNAKLRVEDNLGAWDVDTVGVLVQGSDPNNLAPTAFLVSNRTTGNAPLAIDFAAGGTDPDGWIVLYEWDFNGDGEYDSYGTSTTASHDYTVAGLYNPVVRVTDNDGATDTETIVVRASGWRLETVDQNTSGFEFCQVLVCGGHPQVLYVDSPVAGFNRLYHKRALDSAGMTWLDSQFYVMEYPAVGIVQAAAASVADKPCAAYVEDNGSGKYNLVYVSAADAEGSAWNTPAATVIAGSDGLESPAIADIGGYPAIAVGQYNVSDWDNCFVLSTHLQGFTWDPPQYPASTINDEGRVVDIHEVDGIPALAFFDGSAGACMYLRADNAAGTGWSGTPLNLGSAGIFSTIDLGIAYDTGIDKDVPALSFSHIGSLKYVQGSSDNGSTWHSAKQIHSGNDSIESAAFATDMLKNVMWIPFSIIYTRDVELATGFKSTDGQRWPGRETVDWPGDIGYSISITSIESDYPALAWVDKTNNSVVFARMY